MRIHHATAAKARKFKITLTIEENEVVATGPKGERLASGLQGNKVLEDAITKLTGKPAKGVAKAEKKAKPAKAKKARKAKRHSEEEAEEDMEDEGGDEEGQSRSVVKAKYKALYKPHKNRSGDELSHRMNAHCSREDDDGEVKINLDALRKFAKANGVWVEGYASLRSRVGTFNGGMAMMNVNNRLRAKLRHIEKDEGRKFDIDKDIVWK